MMSEAPPPPISEWLAGDGSCGGGGGGAGGAGGEGAEYTEPRRGSKWKIKRNPDLLGSLGPLKPIPERIFAPSLCLLWAQNL